MILWLVGLVNPQNPKEWEFCGIYLSEEAAVLRCEGLNWFVAPVTLNKCVPTGMLLWPGAYYPIGEG